MKSGEKGFTTRDECRSKKKSVGTREALHPSGRGMGTLDMSESPCKSETLRGLTVQDKQQFDGRGRGGF